MARHHGRISLAAIFDSYSEGLVRAFQETERGLGLPIDRGEGREKALRKFLEDNLPKRYGVGTGFVINSKGQQSKQADIIIYDAGICPMFSLQGTCAYPIEAVYGMIEVKSTLDKKSFGEAWENAHRFKQVAWGDILTERKNSPKQFIHAR
ncbi:MAG: hypothetical protein FJ272_11360, partial [Planctomycetes bacterium]|nr:hypothetical protein [Planctomycetota bacterium]